MISDAAVMFYKYVTQSPMSIKTLPNYFSVIRFICLTQSLGKTMNP